MKVAGYRNFYVKREVTHWLLKKEEYKQIVWYQF